MGTLGNKGSNNFKGKTFGRRTCYNFDSPKHFVEDCPYERREEKSEKLILRKKRVMMMSTREWPLLPCIPSPPPPHQASSTPPTRIRPSPTDASWQER